MIDFSALPWWVYALAVVAVLILVVDRNDFTRLAKVFTGGGSSEPEAGGSKDRLKRKQAIDYAMKLHDHLLTNDATRAEAELIRTKIMPKLLFGEAPTEAEDRQVI